LIFEPKLKRVLQRRCRQFAAYAVLFFIASAGPAGATSTIEDHTLRIVIFDDGDATKQIVAAIKRRYPSSQVLAGATATNTKGQRTIDVAVGPAALRALLESRTNGVVVSVFTSSPVYRDVLDRAQKGRTSNVSAVFAEPDPADQLQLISRLYKRRVRVGVLVSEMTAYLIPGLMKAATVANVDLRVEHINAGESPTRALNRLANATAILAIPDSNVYNTGSIRSILDTTYRRNQAVVGFSPSMVRAGVLASTYSDVDNVVAHLADLLTEFAKTGVLPVPQYPKYFQVQVNDSVARSLNIVVDEPAREFFRKPGAK
jgi:ABC-type uncharacterized transport system substrate-binding protein